MFDPAALLDDEWETCQRPATDPVHCDRGPVPAVVDLATLVVEPGRLVLRALGGVVLDVWRRLPQDTDTTHLAMACTVAPDHGFVVTGARWEQVGWVLSGLVPVGWSAVA
jgi:hypothetical protein